MKHVVLSQGERLKRADIRRGQAVYTEIARTAQAIVDEVRCGGDEALRAVSRRIDGCVPVSFRVSPELLEKAQHMVDPKFLCALSYASDRIRAFHEKEAETSWFTTHPDGTILGVKVSPLESAAVYVPGGRAQYPSTVLMDVLPAKVAGVSRIIMLTPPGKGGTLSPYTLAAAALAQVDEVYAVGGAQAIAAAAYGTESIVEVDKIVGPGNAYVAAAKRYVSGAVGIDMIAGPSEVCVVADDAADPVIIAADLMAQAEHDPLAASYLVCRSERLAERVETALSRLCVASPRKEITQASLDTMGLVVVCSSEEQMIDAVNAIAPEHLELHVKDGFAMMAKVRSAGAIFVGPWSSEPLGDYLAGPNHTLPTSGTARFSSPLGVYDFQTRSSVISYAAEGLAADAPRVQTLAQAEGLWAHALSVGLRSRLAHEGRKSFESLDEACHDLESTAWPVALSDPGVLRIPCIEVA